MGNRITSKLSAIRVKFMSPTKRAEYFRKYVFHMGKNVQLYVTRLGTEPYLVSIGDNVTVAASVMFITHDVSAFNMARLTGDSEYTLDKVGSVVLKNNCMIGARSLLMPGCEVGENSVIAAGSVVTRKVPDNEVWGGVPAKFIMTMEEYRQKLIAQNEAYPWMKNGKFVVPQGSAELISMRQEYFFGKQ